jgi:hypothetical protein
MSNRGSNSSDSFLPRHRPRNEAYEEVKERERGRKEEEDQRKRDRKRHDKDRKEDRERE